MTELLPGTRRALLHRVATAQADGRAPSMVAAVVRDGRMVWTAARGGIGGQQPDVDMQYRVGSLTKTFAAVLVLRLRDDGRLDLSDRLEQHLPGTGVGQISIAQLLAHTGGLAAVPPGPWWERTPGELRPALSDVLGERPVAYPAGRRYHYSSSGYALLGALVERLRGQPWQAVLRTEVLEPLGMTRTVAQPEPGHATGWAVHPWADVLLPEPTEDYGPMAASGQLWSTAADLCRWASFLIAGDDRVLSAATVAEMRTPASPPDDSDQDAGYGLGVQLLRRDGQHLVGHTGSVPGFLAALWVSPDDGVGAVTLANATAGPVIGRITADLVKIVTEQEPRIPDVWRPLTDADPVLLDLAGPWYWGPFPFVIRVEADRTLDLAPLAGRGRRSRLRPEPDGTWTGLDGYFAGETLRIGRDSDGVVTHLDLCTYILTRAPYDPDTPIPGGVDPAGWRSVPR
ncbi:MAG TPA: serine hydrolase domain-containing protein [Pilimelia sp.]|nr:serine hydrolase domain-containing protein [Pilimelia sp.]